MTFTRFVLIADLASSLSACSAERVMDRPVDTTLFAGKTVVKTGEGPGKLVVRGSGAVIGHGGE